MKKLTMVLIGLMMVGCDEPVDPKAIPGAKQVDLYMNLTKLGFTDEVVRDPDLGVSHINTKSENGVTYHVTSFGTSDDLYSYSASVNADFDLSKYRDAKEFVQFLSSLPYEGGQPQVMHEWAGRNSDKKEMDTVVGGVRFQILNPTKFARMLRVEKAN